MMSLFQRRYHLVLLGLAVLAAIGSIIFLLRQSEEFHNSFADSPLSGKSMAYTNAPSSITINALELLKNGGSWNPRADGASPFVSRPYILRDGQLIDPVTGDTPLHPPVPNRWLIDHNLDYTDMNILERDPKHKGFTVLEEFQAGTDPNNPTQFPPLCKKLSYNESGNSKKTYLLEFLGEEENNGRKEFALKPGTPLPNPERGNRPDTSTRGVVRGEVVPGAEFLRVVDYRELPKKVINETEYDANELVLENIVTKEKIILLQKNGSREYKLQLKPIELTENVTFGYRLSGAQEEAITTQLGKEFTLYSLDKSHSESFTLVSLSKDGAHLQQKDGKSFTVPYAALAPAPSGQTPQ